METRFAFSLRWVDTDLERPRWRATGTVRVVPRLQLGVEFNPVVGEIAPLATAFVLHESERWPGVFVGTSSDRIGSPEGEQAYYGTVTKHVPLLRASPYVSLHYSEWSDGWLVPFGAHVDVGRGFGVQPMYDGERTHLLGTYTKDRWSASLIWAWLERVGAAVSVGF